MKDMYTSESINELAAAFSKAQAAMVLPRPTQRADAGKRGVYHYADLADVLEAVRRPFGENGLSVVQATNYDGEHFSLLTRLFHSSGQWIESNYPLPNEGNAQELGSEITYARRYSLAALLGIAADPDDDGATAQRQPQRQANPAPTPTPIRTAAPVGPQPPLREAAATPGTAALLFRDGWKVRCPIHGDDWREGQQGHWHPLSPTGACQRTPTLTPLIKARMGDGAKAKGWDPKRLNEWVKANGNGEQWSGLNTDQKIRVMEAFEADVAEDARLSVEAELEAASGGKRA